MTNYNIKELEAQVQGLEMRIKRFKFLRAHTQDTTKIDRDIRQDEINLALIRNIIAIHK